MLGTAQITAAPEENLTKRVYNISGFALTPEELAAELRAIFPGFDVKYEPDWRDRIAQSWPDTVDDSAARQDWGWAPEDNLESTCNAMLGSIRDRALQAFERLENRATS